MADKYKTRDVFGLSRELPKNYVTRKNVDALLVDSLTRDRHLIVYGGSKQGKTSLRKYHLRDDECLVVSCQSNWDVAQLHEAILKGAGYKVERAETKTTSGAFKVLAEASGGLKIPFIGKTEAKVGADAERAGSDEIERAALELDPADANDIIAALTSLHFDKLIVLEDFHYLPIDTQQQFSFALKAFHENSSYCFMIVGVWKEQNRLIRFNGDLTGRVVSVDADRWTADELGQVIARGEDLLNIKFPNDFKLQLINECYEAVYLVQEACFKVCEEGGVYETQDAMIEVRPAKAAREYLREVIDLQAGRYRGFMSSFAYGFSDTKLEMYKWILYAILKAAKQEIEAGLKLKRVMKLVQEKHPTGKDIQAASFTNALTRVGSLQAEKNIRPIIIDYDDTNRKLDVVDVGYIIWLMVNDRNELIEELGIAADFDGEQKLV